MTPTAKVRDILPAATAALTIAALVPIWAFRYFPSQDGPSHLYNTYVLLHWNDPATVFNNFYEVHLGPTPNWLGTALLYLFMLALPPLAAEKTLVSLYLIAMAACWGYWLRSVDHRRSPLLPAGPLLALSFPLYMGFYSFCLGIPAFLLAIGYGWRHRHGLTWRSGIVLNLLLAVTYLAHLIPFCLALGFAGLALVLQPLTRRNRSAREFLHPLGVAPAVALLIPGLLTAASAPTVNPARLDAATLASYFLRAEWLVSFGDEQLVISCGFMLLLAAMAAFASLRAARGELKLEERWLPAAFAGLLVVLYVVAPRGMAEGWYLNERLALFPILVAAPLLAIGLGRKGFAGCCAAVACLVVGQIGIAFAHHASLSRDLAEYASLGDRLERNTVLLPLTWPSGRPDRRFLPFMHAASYDAIASAAIDLGNYEARTTHFPVRFRRSVVFLETGGPGDAAGRSFRIVAPPPDQLEWDPETLDLRRYARGVDYLITWNLREAAPPGTLQRCLAGFDLIAENGRAILMRRKGGTVAP